MLFQPPRPSLAPAIALAAAGIMLAVAGCSHLAPLGPVPPQPQHLGSPIILQAMRSQSGSPSGGCPAGSLAFVNPSGVGIGFRPISPTAAGPPKASRATAPAGSCYRKLGTPLRITIAAISQVSAFHPPPPPGGGPAPTQYGLVITLPAAGAAALAAVTTRAFHSKGYLDISVAGKTWLLPQVSQPFTSPLQILLASRNRAFHLRHLLIPSG